MGGYGAHVYYMTVFYTNSMIRRRRYNTARLERKTDDDVGLQKLYAFRAFKITRAIRACAYVCVGTHYSIRPGIYHRLTYARYLSSIDV